MITPVLSYGCKPVHCTLLKNINETACMCMCIRSIFGSVECMGIKMASRCLTVIGSFHDREEGSDRRTPQRILCRFNVSPVHLMYFLVYHLVIIINTSIQRGLFSISVFSVRPKPHWMMEQYHVVSQSYDIALQWASILLFAL